jgi:hypothetical protein
MSPRLCTTKHFTITQLKLFTLVGVANFEALNSSMELAPTVVSGRWFHSRVGLWKEFLRVSGRRRRRYNAVVRVCMIYWLRFQNFLQKDMYILDNSQWVFHVRTSTCPSYIYLKAWFLCLPFVTVSMFISLYLWSDWLRSTGNFVVNHLKLFIWNKIYIEPCQ